MAPGQRLVEEELAGTLGVTRASLRAALFDLAAEGLVERIPNRGARVRAVTVDEAVAITECRMALEGLCAAKAADRVTGPEAARLRQIGEEMERSVADGELLKYSALNHELHRLVREISGQAVAASLLERLNGQLVRHQFQLSLRPGRPQASLPEHLAIIAAVAGRRPAEAEEAIRRHLRSVITALGISTERQGSLVSTGETTLVVSAHAADFVWRAGGAIALATVARRPGHGAVPELRRARRVGQRLAGGPDAGGDQGAAPAEAESAAAALGAEIEFLDAGDYPLRESDELVDRIVRVYREVNPSVVLTHTLADPYNHDHPAAGADGAAGPGAGPGDRVPRPRRADRRAAGLPVRAAPAGDVRLQARGPAGHHPGLRRQAQGDGGHGRPAASLGVLHRPGQTARHAAPAQRRAEPRACRHATLAEAYMRVFPQVTDRLG